ncbi:hypothetical protein F5Y12DRAFT_623996 [Xylaria sp. FL1777]|nr:hypothetical protein F5Y12DRAFT_623996 [Xylaria sp. FL1777]
MNYDPISYLGLSCPSGGDFYICQDSETKFLGCCDTNPCGSDGGECPSSAIRPSSFDADKYNDIPPGSCIASTKYAYWYTCTSGPTFLGCCASNPCNNGGICPQNDLVGAVLNSDPSKASVFLTATTVTATSTSPTHTSKFAPTSSPVPSSTPGQVSSKSSGELTGGIVGGIIGGIAILVLGTIVLFLCRRRRRRRPATVQSHGDAIPTSPPWSPYHDSFNNHVAVPPAPVSPPSAMSTPRSLSASLRSIIGFKLPGAKERWSFRTSAGRETPDAWARTTNGNGHVGWGFPTPVMELDSSPRGGLVPGPIHASTYYEVQG